MSSLPELPAVNKSEYPLDWDCVLLMKFLFVTVQLSVSRLAERRGSIQRYTPSQWYKKTLKGSILHRVGVEGQSTLILVGTL